ncbi:sugar phosphate isomerase/epimerase family protein [Pontibacter silvestris]|uniref:Sugar phosphate isomerase/epimerase family protein n=1 Tax=Pontibacter silvestris TaxID=2305183 RepID=A0ABW4X4V0_9BACT|nr:sugar phosphate isomerase/epimerase [Pontibacter silvestris]MCC9134824.1 sugar phosphate isomerase/epimerase [Pontibacter silvestris]
MCSRRYFLKSSASVALGALFLPVLSEAARNTIKVNNVGIQLYTVRKAMLNDAAGTLKQLAQIGYKELESARSEKGLYYGLQPKEIKNIAEDLGMTLRSGHVHIDNDWERTVAAAAETGQDYLICSTLPSQGQTVANYQHCADTFSKAAEDCKKAGVMFGYHNHDYEFEKETGQVLYDVLLDRTDPEMVKMEMDLGWVILTGNDPVTYFEKYPGRFPLWHLKDMDKDKLQSTEFGKGAINITRMLQNADKSKMKYFFVEQEEYTGTAMNSVKYNFNYLKKLHM